MRLKTFGKPARIVPDAAIILAQVGLFVTNERGEFELNAIGSRVVRGRPAPQR